MKSYVKLPVMLSVLGAVAFGVANAAMAATKSQASQQSYTSQQRWSQDIRDRDAQEGN